MPEAATLRIINPIITETEIIIGFIFADKILIRIIIEAIIHATASYLIT